MVLWLATTADYARLSTTTHHNTRQCTILPRCLVNTSAGIVINGFNTEYMVITQNKW